MGIQDGGRARMEPFEQCLPLWLSQRDGRARKPRQAERDDEVDRRAAYRGVRPEMLCPLEARAAVACAAGTGRPVKYPCT